MIVVVVLIAVVNTILNVRIKGKKKVIHEEIKTVMCKDIVIAVK